MATITIPSSSSSSSSSSSNQDYDVYINASNAPLSKDKFNEPNIYIVYRVITNYSSNATLSSRQIRDDPKADTVFSFPCEFLISSSSLNMVSKLISDMNIESQRYHWRQGMQQQQQQQPWTVLEDVDDLIKHIVDFARQIVSEVMNNTDSKIMKGIRLSIKKEITLPHSEFEKLEKARKEREREQRNLDAIENMLSIEAMSGQSLPRWCWEEEVEEPFLERALMASREQAERLFKPVVRATESSIKKLEDVIVGDGERGPCPVCLENFTVGSHVTRMPCSHTFHRTCILSWLNKSHVCPLCRFHLPSEYSAPRR
ncbi:hypothetical protein CMV_029085 [Castanea mollissima]|uniref:RING-type E3 ubiquitin transferase n=1 Tax=Castanea mollissima TaxID=60419 RepID=A0A8J4Q612_9ROSI|nr:hypothetical protein CMV_029085 [Castanea mollissima]